jgi:lycopene beta-cyclase
MNHHYDYIFAGCGCAAFSILVRMVKHPELANKKILIIDKDEKIKNDRTWSWWEEQPNPFSHLAIQEWDKFQLGFDGQYTSVFIAPFKYKTVLGDKFYAYSKQQIKNLGNITWVKENIKDVQANGTVITENQKYTADFVFNSIYNIQLKPNDILLWQHFLGHFIETENEVFNPHQATWMDFNVPQQNGATFMYVLPFSPTKALVEYTIFSDSVLPQNVYVEQIDHYLKQQNIGAYKVYDMEFDKIPMTTFIFPKRDHKILFIGSAGGATRASTGFTFNGIQQQADHIIGLMLQNNLNQYSYTFSERVHQQLDKVMLKLLHRKTLDGATVFGNLFQKNPASRILKFLSGDTSMLETLQVMNSVQKGKFIRAFFK